MMTNIVAEGTCPAKTPISILGVPFDHVTTSDAVELIERMIASGRPHYAVTANVDFVAQAQSDVELHRILFNAHLVLCDGTPLVWASKLLGNPLPERVAGADLVPLLIQRAAKEGYRLFFLGASPAAAMNAGRRLRREFPNLVFDCYSPPFRPLLEMDHDDIARRIHTFRPDILFVSLGCPKQEKWIAMHYESLGVPVSMGVGATIDFLAGQVKRAPAWMQRTGLEWMFRLVQEPRRLFNRYVTDLRVFGSRICMLWCGLHLRRAGRCTESIPIRSTKQWQWLRLPSRLNAQTVREQAPLFDRLLGDSRHCLLDAGNVKFIDSTGVGLLSRLQKTFRSSGRELVLLAPGRPLRCALQLMGLQNFFASAPSVAVAEELIQTRLRERAQPVTPRTAAAVNPLLWQGEVTTVNAGEVWEQMQARLTSPRCPRQLLVDLAGLRVLDTRGVEVMLRTKRLAWRRGVQLDFINVRPEVRNVLRFARFDTLVPAPSGPPGEPAPAGPLVLSQST